METHGWHDGFIGKDRSTGPTAQLVLPLAEVSSQTVSEITIQFSEPITGLSLDDLRLSRDLQPLELSEAELLELAPGSYQLNVDDLAAANGTYQLLLLSGATGIADNYGNVFRTPTFVQWVKLFTEPTLVDGLLTLSTTSRSETLELNILADSADMWVNGLNIQFPLANVSHIRIDPLAGTDVVSIEVLASAEFLPLA